MDEHQFFAALFILATGVLVGMILEQLRSAASIRRAYERSEEAIMKLGITGSDDPSLSDKERDVRTFFGLPPFDDWSNHAYRDPYFARKIRDKYGRTPDELAEEIGLDTNGGRI